LAAGLPTAGGLALIGAGFVAHRPHQALVLLFLMNAFQGAREPLVQAWFNEEVASEARATMISFRGMMATAGGAIGLLLSGVVAGLRGISPPGKMAGTPCLLSVPPYLGLRPLLDLTPAAPRP